MFPGKKERHTLISHISNMFTSDKVMRPVSFTLKSDAFVYLPEKDVTVRAEVQGVTVLLSVRIAATQLKVHLLPLQMTFI